MDAEQRQDADSILDDVFCMSCDYNLRTLRQDSVCPECATSVADSLRRYSLRLRNPEWLRQIHTGAYWLYNWIQAVVLAHVLIWMSSAVIRGVPVSRALGALAALLGWLGVRRFTCEEPGHPVESASEEARHFARKTLLTVVAASAVILAVGPVGPTWHAGVYCVWYASILGSVLGVRRYANDLARQTPSGTIAKSIGAFTWLGVGTSSLGLAMHVVMLAPASQRSILVSTVAEAFGAVFPILGLFVALLALRVLWAIRSEYRKASRAK